MRATLEKLNQDRSNKKVLTRWRLPATAATATVDYWPGFVDALSTLLLAIMFLLSVFVLAQFLLSREISGKDEVLNRLNSQINELTQLLALEKSSTQDLQDQLANLQASLDAAEGEKSRLQQLLEAGQRQGRRGGNQAWRGGENVDAERQISQRALARSSCSTSRSPRCASRSARSRTRSTRPRTRDREIQHQDRRPRPPPQRGAGAARAGTQPLPLRLLRPAARNPVRPREHPHRRRPFRLPVGSAVPVRRRSDQRGRQRRNGEARRRHHRAGQGNPAGDQLGAARRRPHRQRAAVGRRPYADNWELSSAAPPRWSNSSSRTAFRPTGWSPPASASSSRSTRPTRWRPSGKNRRIELKLTEK